jgi:phage shock protein A
MSLVDHTYNQYIDAYRVNFRNWKIVDIDNYMEGNHFFSELKDESVWNNKVTEAMGGGKHVPWKEEEAKSPLFAREILIPELSKVVQEISQLDTKSNREMSPLHKRRAEILQKIEELKAQEANKEANKETKGSSGNTGGKKQKKKAEGTEGKQATEAAEAS